METSTSKPLITAENLKSFQNFITLAKSVSSNITGDRKQLILNVILDLPSIIDASVDEAKISAIKQLERQVEEVRWFDKKVWLKFDFLVMHIIRDAIFNKHIPLKCIQIGFEISNSLSVAKDICAGNMFEKVRVYIWKILCYCPSKKAISDFGTSRSPIQPFAGSCSWIMGK